MNLVPFDNDTYFGDYGNNPVFHGTFSLFGLSVLFAVPVASGKLSKGSVTQ